MKKTAQTLLTAAIFATALGSTVPSQFRQPVQALDDPIAEVETNLVEVYGPPAWFTTPQEETTTTHTTRRIKPTTVVTTTPETTAGTTTTATEPVLLYGPPWVFMGVGDANGDDVPDARDLTIIKRLALEGREAAGNIPNMTYVSQYDVADVDHNGIVDADDVHAFMKNQLGVPYKKPDVTTTAPVTTTAEEGTTLTTTTPIVYWRTDNTKNTTATQRTKHTKETEAFITDLLPFTDTAIVALYGPPNTGIWDDQLRWDTYEDLHPGESPKTTMPPQDQTTKTETVDEANRNKEK